MQELEHSAILSEGRLYMFGCNEFGQLGIGNTTDWHRPILVPVLPDNPAAFLQLSNHG